MTSWVDGRVAISGQSQQDAFTDREVAGLSVTTTDPACNSVVFTQPTDFTVNVSIAVDPNTLQASDFTVNGARGGHSCTLDQNGNTADTASTSATRRL